MRIKWNKNWRFWKEENTFALTFSIPESAKLIDLPHDALFEEIQKKNSMNQGRTGYLDGQAYNYYKELEVYDQTKQYDLFIHGIGGIAKVYVNESCVDEIHYPYLNKKISISDYLNYDGKDFILIQVNSMNLSSRYYVGAGLTRDIELIEKGNIYLEDIKIETTKIENYIISFNTKGQLNKNGTISFKIKELFEDTFLSEKNFCKEYSIKGLKPWSDAHPNLYDFEIYLNGKLEEKIQIGFRTIEIKNGLYINGVETKLRGACLHHDQGLLGAATYDDYERYRITKCKEAGFNAIRSAHNPASTSLLKACDEIGMYVMDEAFDMWSKPKNINDFSIFFEKEKEEVIKNMIDHDYNHSSVILYSTGNEIGDIHTKKGMENSLKLTQYFHKFDPSRPVTCGINGAFSTGNELIDVAVDLTGKDRKLFESGDINQFMMIISTQMDDIVQHKAVTKILNQLKPTMDIMGYNYMTSRYKIDQDRVIVGTETYPKQIGTNWIEINKYHNVLGDFTWTGFDYLGENSHYPEIINTSGDISIIGQRRPVSYYREIVFGLTHTPCISIRSPYRYHASYEMGPWKLTDSRIAYDYKKGDLLQVEVFSNGDEIELLQNNKLIERKKNHSFKPCMTLFDITYIPGKLEALSFKEGKEIGRVTISTPGKINDIQTKIYTYTDLTFVEFYLVDQDNNIVTNENGKIMIEGNVLACASTDPVYDKGFHTIELKDGVGLVITKNSFDLYYKQIHKRIDI